ncbi:MAG: magnesium transporter CorA family protein [Actinobacteria bacterium]|nr:magnesium transporter CorA family protein [Actinomycetota bacterium]
MANDRAATMNWSDLLDPDEETVRAAWGDVLDEETLRLICAPPAREDLPRPGFRVRSDIVLAIFLLPLLVDNGSDVVHQEIDVLMSSTKVIVVRKTPDIGPTKQASPDPYDISDLVDMFGRGEVVVPGKVARVIADDVAEAFLDLADELVDRIDDLEDTVETTDDLRSIHREISRFRHDLLHLRRIVTPTRDAVRRVVDGRVEIADGTLFPHELELEFGDVYDKLLRAGDALETARELVGGVRDYVQAEVANDQNEVMKRLTAAASILLVPTFIVGLYGQNFVDIPELHWRYGYAYSWGLILGTTLLQLWWFRHKKWI